MLHIAPCSAILPNGMPSASKNIGMSGAKGASPRQSRPMETPEVIPTDGAKWTEEERCIPFWTLPVCDSETTSAVENFPRS